MKKPVIGINADLTRDGKDVRLSQEYVRVVLKAGGIPVLLPCAAPAADGIPERMLDGIDGLLLSGGRDLNPRFYGEKILNRKVILLPELKQGFDLALVKSALKRKMPILAICYGVQLINVALGGSLFQDIASQLKSAANHRQGGHKIRIVRGTLLHRIINKEYITANSFHHQAIKTPGGNLAVNARAADDVIEGVELPGGFCLGLQWHPERMPDKKEQVKLFKALVQYAAR
jgi:putative glutamine amidotransferase